MHTSPTAEAARVLIVEDELRFGRLVTAMLGRAGYRATHAKDGRDALERLALERFDVVVSDVQMPGLDGLRLLKEVKRTSPATEVILMTAYATTERAVTALREGARDCLIKPFEMAELRRVVGEALARRPSVAPAPRTPPALFGNIVGDSPAMRETFELVEQVAPTDATVLLRGETGTGKSLLARAIHRASRRVERPFVEIHCAALPEALLESELFGHEKGAFTGANTQTIGLLEAADGGTIFLDEIGEVPLPVQVKLLRFLQSREFVRVGGREVLRVDVRVVAATNADLEAAMQARTFREDLYYRLNVFPIDVPPLRHHPADVPALVGHFLSRVGRGLDSVSPEAMERLHTWHWPGNVRELENVMERCLVIARDGRIELNHLPRSLRTGPIREPSITGPVGEVVGRASTPPPRLPILDENFSLDDFERQLIIAAVAQAGGNKSRAALLLGVTRRRLYSMIDRFGIEL